MSRFLDRTRTTRNIGLGDVAAAQPNPEQWVEVLNQTVCRDAPQFSLTNCRETRLNPPTEVPLLAQTAGAVEAYRMLRTRLMRAQTAQNLRSLVFSSAVNSEGKTFTAFNLAQAYVILGDQRVLLIDGDLRTGALSRFFTPNAGPGLSEALVGDANFPDVVLATDKPNLFFVSTGKNPAPPPELYAGKRWKEFLQACTESFEVILVDAPPIFPLSDFDLMSAACDAIVLVVRAQHTSRELLQRAAAQVDSRKVLGLVYNATQSDNRKSECPNQRVAGDSQT
jgi:capsular exopolysaccharide synthesis family protein